MYINTTEILLIRRVEKRKILAQDIHIFLLKNLSVLRVHLIAIVIIFSVLRNLINEKQGQCFDAAGKQILLLFKVRTDGFSDLYTAQVSLGHISNDFSGMDCFTVGKGHNSTNRINFADTVSSILIHIFGECEKVIVHAQEPCLAVDGLIVSDFKLDARHRRFLRRDNNALQEKIAVRSAQILDIKAFDLDSLNQPLVVGIQRVKHIHQFMVLFVRSGIVQAKERIKLFQTFLRGSAAHFLRLIKDNNRTVRLDNVNWFSAAEVIQFRADTPCILSTGIESLNVYNHDVDICTLAEVINLRQILRIVHEETSLLAVIFHKVILHGLKTLADALSDSNARHDHDKLAPAVLLVQFKHGLYIDVGLTRSSLHLHVKGAGAKSSGRYGFRQLDIIASLNPAYIIKKLSGIKLHTGIGKAHIQFFFWNHPVCYVSFNLHISAVGEAIVERLTCKHTYYAFYSLGLVRLYGKFEFHICHYNTFLCVFGL